MADLIVLAGRALGVVRPPTTEPVAIVVAQGRISEVLPAADGTRRHPRTPVLDRRGSTCLPGFGDAHNHQPSAVRDLSDVATSHVRSLSELQQVLRAAAADRPAGQWIVTERNLTRSQLTEHRFPTVRELDEAVPDHPTMVRFGAHAAALNSLAFAATGLAAMADDPPGGRVPRDRDGVPLGPIHEYGALRLVDTARGPEVDGDQVAALARVQRRYLDCGITAVRVPGVRPGELAWYQALRDRGEPVRTRVSAAVRVDPTLSHRDKLALLERWEVRTGWGDDELALDALKLFVDGAVEGDPDRPETMFLGPDELRDLVLQASSRGWSVACHAVTAPAIEQCLEAFTAARDAGFRGTLAIEHALFATATQLRRAAALDVWLSVQPSMLDINGHVLDERTRRRALPLRSALEAGVRVALGSDWNATPGTALRPYAPLRSLHLATRHGEESLDAGTALRLHTQAPADLAGRAAVGRIARGAWADLLLFDGVMDADELVADLQRAPSDVIVAGHLLVSGAEDHTESTTTSR